MWGLIAAEHACLSCGKDRFLHPRDPPLDPLRREERNGGEMETTR